MGMTIGQECVLDGDIAVNCHNGLSKIEGK